MNHIPHDGVAGNRKWNMKNAVMGLTVAALILSLVGLFSGLTAKRTSRVLEAQIRAVEDQLPAVTESASSAQKDVQTLRGQVRDAFTGIQNEFAALRTELAAKSTPVPVKKTSPATADDQTKGASASGRTHEFRAGDTLGRVAGKYSVSLKALQDANPGIDARKIRVGQKINLP